MFVNHVHTRAVRVFAKGVQVRRRTSRLIDCRDVTTLVMQQQLAPQPERIKKDGTFLSGVGRKRPQRFHPSLFSRRSPNPLLSAELPEPPREERRFAIPSNRSIHYHTGEGGGGGGEGGGRRDASLHVPRTCTHRLEAVAYFGKTARPVRLRVREFERIMATLNKLSAACWRSFRGDRLNERMLTAVRALHKSAASETFGMSAAGEEAAGEPLITPADARDQSAAKSLKEMPGPSILANLVEFFWRDGFSRIHEIQVKT